MNLKSDARSLAVEKIQNSFNNPAKNTSSSNEMITRSNNEQKRSTSPTSMLVAVNYETFAPKNHLE